MWVSKEIPEFFHDIVGDSDDAFNSSFINTIFSQELIVSRPLDDVPGNSAGLGEFEIPINEVGYVGEVQAQILFVVLEPLVLGGEVIEDFSEGCLGVGEKEPDCLR